MSNNVGSSRAIGLIARREFTVQVMKKSFVISNVLILAVIIGGIVAFCSFGAIMLATRLDKVGEAAVLRETSTVFAALIGWLFLGEHVGKRRAALMALVALGAVIVEMGG